MSKICLTCGNEVEDAAHFCDICGTEMNEQTCVPNAPPKSKPKPTPPTEIICPHCEQTMPIGAKFCRTCGAVLSKDAEQPPKAGTESAFSSQQKAADGDAARPSNASWTASDPNASPGSAAPMPSAAPSRTPWKVIGSIGSAIGTIVTVLMVIAIFVNFPISDTQSIVFDQWGPEEFGTVVERSLEDAEWTSEKISDKCYYVTVSGYHREISSMVSITFETTYMGDSVYVQPIRCRWLGDTYSDVVSLALVMELIYG